MSISTKRNRIISIYEIVGGLVGLVTTIFMTLGIFSQSLLHEDNLFIFLFVALIVVYATVGYVLSLVAGLLLRKGQNRGILLSLIAQIIQIPQFTIAGFSYVFISGLQFTLLIKNFSLDLTTYIGSQWNISFLPNDQTFMIGINIIALIVFVYLIRQYRRNKTNP